jgi:hypothetical protein
MACEQHTPRSSFPTTHLEHRARILTLLVAACCLAACGTASRVASDQTSPKAPAVLGSSSTFGSPATITGPITTGQIIEPLTPVALDLASYGYQEQEFFASGTATKFRATASPSDGRWSVVAESKAFYRTRIIVRRPIDPRHFDGTVLVEWFNVSGGESDPDWAYLNPELMREGAAYVGVSVQSLGVEGGTPILGLGPTEGLVKSEPARYGSLVHPGDAYALDIFDQIGRALREGRNRAVFGNLHPRRFLADGESQSAFYLTTYADAIEPATHTFDGLFIHSRGGGGMPIDGATKTSMLGGGLLIRTDLHVPVFMFETQSDPTILGFASAQQPDTKEIRTWEVAGTAHADAYLVGSVASLLGCSAPVNDGPQHYVAEAAFASLNKWVTYGTPPPSPPFFDYTTMNPPTYALDSHGNVLGGVRTPAVDVPVSTLSGEAPPGSSPLCALFGSTVPFSQAELTSLYHDKANYLAEFTRDLDHAIAGGYILPVDRQALLDQAEQVQIG